MSTVIRFKRKNTTGSAGITLLPGEPFFNVKDKKFYIGNDEGKPQDIAGIKINNDAAADTVDFTIGTDQYQKTINNVANVSKTVGGRNIDDIFETDSPVVKKSSVANDVTNMSLSKSEGATVKLTWGDGSNQHEESFTVNAGSISGTISNAANVTERINGQKISDIFATDGKKVKNAESADSATKLTSSNGSELQPVYFQDGKPVNTRYKLDYATDSKPGIIMLGTVTTGNQLSLLKSTDGEGYVDVTEINNRIKTCEESLTWRTF